MFTLKGLDYNYMNVFDLSIINQKKTPLCYLYTYPLHSRIICIHIIGFRVLLLIIPGLEQLSILLRHIVKIRESLIAS